MPVFGAAAANLPTVVDGLDYWAAGNSYTTGFQASNSYSYAKRIARVFGLNQRNLSTIAVGGTFAMEIANVVYPNTNAGSVGNYGIADLYVTANDINSDGLSTAKARLGFQNALLMSIYAMRARALYTPSGGRAWGTATTLGGSPNGSVAFAYGSGWNDDFTLPTPGVPGGAIKSTTTVNSFVDITINGKECMLLLSGYDTATSGTLGAAYTIKQGATTLVTGNTNDQFLANTVDGPFLAIPVKVNFSTAGPNTLRLTKTDSNTNKLGVIGMLIPYEITIAGGGGSYTPKTVMVYKQGYLPAYSNGGTNATVDLYNGYIDSAIASFAAPTNELTAINLPDWTVAQHVCADGLHPNELGHAYIAQQAVKYLLSLGFRTGQNVPN